jgi:hypothetical protein
MDVRAQDHFTERCLKLLQNNMVFLSDELICIWSSFSKLESSIGCSLKSFPSYLKLDNLVVIMHDVIYILSYNFWWILFHFLFHFFDVFSKRWKSLILVRKNWFSRKRLLVGIAFELILHRLILWFKIIDKISKVLLVLVIRSCYVLLHGFYYFWPFFFVYTTFVFSYRFIISFMALISINNKSWTVIK